MKRLFDKIDFTLFTMCVGILFFGILCELVGVWFVPDKSMFTIGLVIGIALALVDGWHMWWSISRNLTINADNEKGANAYSLKSSMIRYAVIIIVFVVLCTTDFAYPLAAFLGIMGLKVGAYLQPFVSKIFNKFI